MELSFSLATHFDNAEVTLNIPLITEEQEGNELMFQTKEMSFLQLALPFNKLYFETEILKEERCLKIKMEIKKSGTCKRIKCLK